VEEASVSLEIELGYPRKPSSIRSASSSRESCAASGRERGERQCHEQIVSHTVQRGVKLISRVRTLSRSPPARAGGKSTTAVNLALALAAEGGERRGARCRYYGPSQPMMLGITGRLSQGRQELER